MIARTVPETADRQDWARLVAQVVNGLSRRLTALDGVYTVGTLPAAGKAGRRAFVTDANATTFASVVAAGGTNKVPVYDDGAAWRIG